MSRIKVLVVIFLYSLLIAGMLHGFKMITTLWSVHIMQETIQLCPKPKALFTENDLGEQADSSNIRFALSISTSGRYQVPVSPKG